MEKKTGPRYLPRLNILGCFTLVHAFRTGKPRKLACVIRAGSLNEMAQKHFEDQARKTPAKDYGHNIPFPADHSGERNDAGEDGEPIDRTGLRKITCRPNQTARLDDRCGDGGIDPVELVVLQIGVMDQLGQPLDRPVPNPESLDQCLERAMIAVMTELDIEHVVRDGQGMGADSSPKTNFASGSMNFRMSQADPTRSISGRVRSPWVSIVTNCRSTCDDCKESASD
jgi:hypothetical protein